MYCPAHFEENRPEILLDLIEHYPLATIVSSSQGRLVADHIPLLYAPINGAVGKLVGHVAKSNPLWQALPDQEHLLIFQGPSTYISPNWYATKASTGKVVPTWNYAVVHVTATLTAFHDPNDLLPLLYKLTDRHEAAQPHPWSVADAPTEYTERLLTNIVGIELHISKMQGKWKVSQNQPQANKRSLVAGLGSLASEAAGQMAQFVRSA